MRLSLLVLLNSVGQVIVNSLALQGPSSSLPGFGVRVLCSLNTARSLKSHKRTRDYLKSLLGGTRRDRLVTLTNRGYRW
ncbi:hypothetical protein ACQ4M4_03165 [Leptolyngbya sp. AN02str]|uniref:hypothetical protein n=1 Tax=Leptolyngbya sp. AN02str TaxID=3423363 RepID=UPI003D31FA9E